MNALNEDSYVGISSWQTLYECLLNNRIYKTKKCQGRLVKRQKDEKKNPKNLIES